MNKRYAKGTDGNAKENSGSEGVDEYRKQFGVEENVHRQYKGANNFFEIPAIEMVKNDL